MSVPTNKQPQAKMDFETYVKMHCPEVKVEKAKEYAAKGKQLLEKINKGDKNVRETLRKIWLV